MLLIALTGNIASGKTEVARMLAELGATVIDADDLAREVVATRDSLRSHAIVKRWGAGVLQSDGTLDRAALRAIVFADPAEREALNAIVHPEVRNRRDELVVAGQGAGRRSRRRVHSAAVRDGTRARIRQGRSWWTRPRTCATHGCSSEAAIAAAEARRMMDAQMPCRRRSALRSDIVIENDSDLAALRRSVERVWTDLTRDGTAAEHSTFSQPREPSLDFAPLPISQSSFRNSAVANVPADLLYTSDHEYVKGTDDPNVVQIGITDYAQDQLGDVVFVELPKKGAQFGAHDVFGTIEAVKAVSELFCPLAGEVVDVNARLDGEPALVNSDPYGAGWMIKLQMKNPDDKSSLLTADAYSKQIGRNDSAERRTRAH